MTVQLSNETTNNNIQLTLDVERFEIEDWVYQNYEQQNTQTTNKISKLRTKYSGDPKTGHVRILNGQPLSNFQMVGTISIDITMLLTIWNRDHSNTNLQKVRNLNGRFLDPIST